MPRLLAVLKYLMDLDSSLSQSRLTKLVYLIDWLAAMTLGDQITEVQWQFSSSGPFSPDLERAVSAPCGEGTPHLDEEQLRVVAEVYRRTENLTWTHLDGIVTSTWPVLMSMRFQGIGMADVAAAYRVGESQGPKSRAKVPAPAS